MPPGRPLARPCPPRLLRDPTITELLEHRSAHESDFGRDYYIPHHVHLAVGAARSLVRGGTR